MITNSGIKPSQLFYSLQRVSVSLYPRSRKPKHKAISSCNILYLNMSKNLRVYHFRVGVVSFRAPGNLFALSPSRTTKIRNIFHTPSIYTKNFNILKYINTYNLDQTF